MPGLITSHADLNFLVSANSIKLVATPLFGPNVFMIFRTVTLILCGNEIKCHKRYMEMFFSIRIFFHRHWQFTGQQGKRRDHALFFSVTTTRLWAFRHLFATLHVRWLPPIFNRIACNYQVATRRVLPSYWITILIDWWCNVSFCLFSWL